MPAEYVIRIQQEPRNDRVAVDIEMEAHKLGVMTTEEETRLQQIHAAVKMVVRAMQRGAIRASKQVLRLPADLLADAAEQAMMERKLNRNGMADISKLIRDRKPDPVAATPDAPPDATPVVAAAISSVN